MASSVLLGAAASGPADVVVVSSPTFFSIGSAWLLARLKRARLVLDIRDLWPAIFTELGVLTNRPIIGALERLELAAYRAADEIVVVSDGFRDNLIGRGVPPGKVHTIRNGVTPRPVRSGRAGRSRDAGPPGRRPGGLPGALPRHARHLPGAARPTAAAARLAAHPVHFAFVGEGADKAPAANSGSATWACGT